MPEDRHRIEQNELALWLEKVARSLRPYARPLAWGAVFVVVAWLATVLYRSTTSAAAARASDALSRALVQNSPTALEDVAQQFGGTIGQLARLAAADIYFATGCDQLFVNKIIARQDLQKALEHYREVERQSRTPDLRARASFGIARTLEALAGTPAGQGLLREAVEKYREIERTFPTSPFAVFARERLQLLEMEETKRFYDQFAKFDPRPELMPEGVSGSPSLGEKQAPLVAPLEATGAEAVKGDTGDLPELAAPTERSAESREDEPAAPEDLPSTDLNTPSPRENEAQAPAQTVAPSDNVGTSDSETSVPSAEKPQSNLNHVTTDSASG